MSNDAKYAVAPRCVWAFDRVPSQPEEALLLELLRGIERERAVGAAARGAGVSYRNAWGLLRRWEIGRASCRERV